MEREHIELNWDLSQRFNSHSRHHEFLITPIFIRNSLGCFVPKKALHCWKESSQRLPGVLVLVNNNSVLTTAVCQHRCLVYFIFFLFIIWGVGKRVEQLLCHYGLPYHYHSSHKHVEGHELLGAGTLGTCWRACLKCIKWFLGHGCIVCRYPLNFLIKILEFVDENLFDCRYLVIWRNKRIHFNYKYLLYNIYMRKRISPAFYHPRLFESK